MDNLASTIGEKIKEVRENLGISQSEFAGRIGVTASLVSQYEKAVKKPSAEILDSISKNFAVSIDYIFGRTPVNELLADEQVVSFIKTYMRLEPKERSFINGVVRELKKMRS